MRVLKASAIKENLVHDKIYTSEEVMSLLDKNTFEIPDCIAVDLTSDMIDNICRVHYMEDRIRVDMLSIGLSCIITICLLISIFLNNDALSNILCFISLLACFANITIDVVMNNGNIIFARIIIFLLIFFSLLTNL